MSTLQVEALEAVVDETVESANKITSSRDFSPDGVRNRLRKLAEELRARVDEVAQRRAKLEQDQRRAEADLPNLVPTSDERSAEAIALQGEVRGSVPPQLELKNWGAAADSPDKRRHANFIGRRMRSDDEKELQQHDQGLDPAPAPAGGFAAFSPQNVVHEASSILREYECWTVVGDRYAGEWPREAFRRFGITYKLADADRSALYLALLPAVNSERIEFPDDPTLLRELRGLERRRGSSGRDRVDHAPGAHDDRANAVAGVSFDLLRRTGSELRIVKVVGW